MKINQSLFNLILLLSFIAVLTSCEDTGEPLTLDDIYEGSIIDSDPFKAKINGFDFESDFVSGGKESGSYFIVGGNSDGSSITLRMNDIQPGLYSGADSSINNISYTNRDGRRFVSNFPAEVSDAQIRILSYSEVNTLATGTFSGTLYSIDSDETVNITNGTFNSAFIVIPFTGKMRATEGQNIFDSEDCSLNTINNGGIVFQEIIGIDKKDSVKITITVEDSLAVGTYDFSNSGISAKYNTNRFSSNLPRDQFNAQTGSLTIDRIDYAELKIIGTFSFEARSLSGKSVSITNGGFQALVK